MQARLEGKIALVIGAGASAAEGGASNGQAVCVTFARHGASVVAADIQPEAAALTARQIAAEGGTAIAVPCDASRAADVAAVVAETLRRYGRIDILHNNVGIEQLGGAVETSEEAWDHVHAVNLKSVFLACKHVIPIMQRQGGGSIVNISSIAGITWSGISYLAYNSSKAALNHVTRMIARQHAPDRIRCNAILPGYMDTPHIRTLYRHLDPAAFAAQMRARDALCPMGRQGTAWDVANAALFLASDEAGYVSGTLLVVDGAASI